MNSGLRISSDMGARKVLPPLWWRYMNAIAFENTDNSTACSTVKSAWLHGTENWFHNWHSWSLWRKYLDNHNLGVLHVDILTETSTIWPTFYTLRWRHNGRDSVSNHQPNDCLLNRLFRRGSQKTSKLRVTGLCAGNSPGTGEFPAQMASNAENVSIWWPHHET